MSVEPSSALRALLVSPDPALEQEFSTAAQVVPELDILERLSDYPPIATLDEALKARRADALLLEVESDRGAALRLLSEVIEEQPALAVVVLARTNDPETILQCLRTGASEFLSSPFPHNELRQAVTRMKRRRRVESKPVPRKRGRLLVFAPAKGGSGATTLAANAAYQIRKETKSRVLLADMDLSAGVIAFLLRLKPPYSVIDALKHSGQLDDALWNSLVIEHEGVDVLAAPERPEPMLIESYPVEAMLDYARTAYDWVIADLGSVLDPLAMAAVSAADQINLVCSTDMTALFLMRRTIPLLEEMGRRREHINVLVNRVERRPELSVEDMEKIFRASVHATFPEDTTEVRRAQREGAVVSDSSALGRGVERFIRELRGIRGESEAGPLGGALRQLWGRA